MCWEEFRVCHLLDLWSFAAHLPQPRFPSPKNGGNRLWPACLPVLRGSAEVTCARKHVSNTASSLSFCLHTHTPSLFRSLPSCFVIAVLSSVLHRYEYPRERLMFLTCAKLMPVSRWSAVSSPFSDTACAKPSSDSNTVPLSCVY